MAYEESGFQRGKRIVSSPLRWLWNIIGFMIGAVLVIFIIAIPLSIAFSEKPLFSYVYSEITDPLINTGIGNFVKKGLSALTIPFSEKKQAEVLESYTWKSTIDNSQGQDLGLRITRFEAITRTTNTKLFSDVEAMAEGSILSTEPTQIEFSCLTEDGKGEVANQNNILSISPNRKEFFAIRCVYNKDNFDIDTNKASDSKKIKIIASYDFTTDAYIPVYILRKDILEIKRQNEEDIFSDISDSNLNKIDGTVSSAYTNGPIKLLLRSIYTQPYTEEGPFGSGSYYTFDIRIDDNIQWTGNLNKIEELELLLPEEINIKSDDFEYTSIEDNFNIYKANSDLMNKLNKICEPRNALEKLKNLIDEDCWRRGDITTNLEFSINNAPEEIEQTFIRARVSYKFSDEKQDTIIFLNT
jgi:hypothetical protein